MAWQEGSIVGVQTGNAKRPLILVRFDGIGNIPNMSIPPDQWVTIDLANGPQWHYGVDTTKFQPNLPESIISVDLSGILIISHTGLPMGTADLYVNFRAPGDTLDHDSYQMQTLTIGPCNTACPVPGVRSNAAVKVPVIDRKFEMYWYGTPGAPVMFNLSIQSYLR